MITTEYIIALVLIIIASLSGAMMDIIQFRYSSKLPSKWNPKNSWKNKWKLNYLYSPMITLKTPWYYFGIYKLEFVERFPYSSTLLVSFTDAWHMFKSIKLNSIFIAFAISMNIPYIEMVYVFFINRILYGLIFEYTFSKFKV